MGAPIGNQNARTGRWSDAVVAAAEIEDPASRRRRMVCIAEKLVAMAMEGDMAAIKEFGDRVDGKAPLAIDANVRGGLVVKLDSEDAES